MKIEIKNKPECTDIGEVELVDKSDRISININGKCVCSLFKNGGSAYFNKSVLERFGFDYFDTN